MSGLSRSKVFLLGALGVAVSICLLTNFANIWIFGKYYIFESNKYILSIETMMMVLIIVFSLSCLYSSFTSGSGDRTNEQVPSDALDNPPMN